MHEEVIFSLKKTEGYLSGEEISRSLSISRSAIWKNIEELRKNGYEIEAVSHKGYRLISAPDKLLPWEISYDLNTKIIGKSVVCKQTVSSTMDEAFRLGFEGAEDGTVVFAESQTKGRGRLSRAWISPKASGVYMSIILRPSLPPRDVAKLTLLTAVAVREALSKVSDVDIKIKWPNDLLVNGKKLVGILTELNAEIDRVKFVVIGIGINVNTSQKSLPKGATSLKLESRKKISRVEVVKEILRSMDNWYEIMKTEGFDPVFKKWKDYSLTIGKRVKVTNMQELKEGVAKDLSDDGGLLIESSEGNVEKIMSGDVEIL